MFSADTPVDSLGSSLREHLSYLVSQAGFDNCIDHLADLLAVFAAPDEVEASGLSSVESIAAAFRGKEQVRVGIQQAMDSPADTDLVPTPWLSSSPIP